MQKSKHLVEMKHLINTPLSLISQLVLSGIVGAFVMRGDKGVESRGVAQSSGLHVG